MPGEVIAIIACVIGVIAVILLLAYQSVQKRIAKMKETASELGFEYLTVLPLDLDGTRSQFELFNTGRRREASNILSRQVDELQVLLFDYAYTTGGGKHQHRHSQSVALFRQRDVSLPKFRLTPERWYSKLGQLFGAQDIDFTEDAEFSSAFVLAGTNESAVRELFATDQRAMLLQHATFSVEAAGDCMIVWSQGRRVAPEQTKEFFEKSFEVYSALKMS